VLHEFNRLTAPPVPAEPEAVPLEALTERELVILQELARGKNNREIADTLFLAEGTVKNYVSAIIAKLHANDRTQAAILALKHGLVRLD
jgi:DNA-binding NarL/FixJ family response regulator